MSRCLPEHKHRFDSKPTSSVSRLILTFIRGNAAFNPRSWLTETTSCFHKQRLVSTVHAPLPRCVQGLPVHSRCFTQNVFSCSTANFWQNIEMTFMFIFLSKSLIVYILCTNNAHFFSAKVCELHIGFSW